MSTLGTVLLSGALLCSLGATFWPDPGQPVRYGWRLGWMSLAFYFAYLLFGHA